MSGEHSAARPRGTCCSRTEDGWTCWLLGYINWRLSVYGLYNSDNMRAIQVSSAVSACCVLLVLAGAVALAYEDDYDKDYTYPQYDDDTSALATPSVSYHLLVSSLSLKQNVTCLSFKNITTGTVNTLKLVCRPIFPQEFSWVLLEKRHNILLFATSL